MKAAPLVASMESSLPSQGCRTVGILLFDEVEVLDFAGPFEVFSVAGHTQNLKFFDVFTVSERPGPVRARSNLIVLPRFSFADCPRPQILLVPGGFGTRKEMMNPTVISWIQEMNHSAELILSVCTGALLLAKAGLLAGLKATTHYGALALLREIAPETEVLPNQRCADNGRIICSAGVSAGIDMAFHVVARLCGHAQAVETARHPGRLGSRRHPDRSPKVICE